MNAYSIALFLHLLVVVIAFGAAALIHFALSRLRAAQRVGEARDALALLARAGRAMPVIGLGLFITGAYLTSVGWAWTTPWIDLSILGLIALEVLGGAVLGPRARRIGMALAGGGAATGGAGVAAAPSAASAAAGGEAGRSVLSDAVTQQIAASPVFAIANIQVGLAVAVMFVMVTKPGYPLGLVAMVVAVGLGAVSGVRRGRGRARGGETARAGGGVAVGEG